MALKRGATTVSLGTKQQLPHGELHGTLVSIMGSCKYEACESDEVCTCQLPEPWTEAQLDSVRRLRYENEE